MKNIFSEKNKIFLILFLLISFNAANGQRNESFKVNKGGTLNLQLKNGDVKIKPWDKDEVYIKAFDDDDIFIATQIGGNINISSNSAASDMEIFVPVQFHINIASAFGDIRCEGNLDGNVQLSSLGGDISLGSVNGNVDAKTEAGDVHAGKINGNGRLSSSGGDISTGDVNGNLEIKTLGGDIKVGNVEKSLSVITQGGNIYTGNVGGSTELKTAGGNIKSGLLQRNALVHTSGGNINLDGCSGNLEAKTYGGNIRISNVSGRVNATTSAGNVSVEFFPVSNTNSFISTSAGDITLLIPESANLKIIAQSKLMHGGNAGKIIQSDFPSSEFINDKESREVRGVYIINQPSSEITVKVNLGTIQIKKLKK